ncbi:22434_t:CDS:2, partial [Dentiscutata erythropus]
KEELIKVQTYINSTNSQNVNIYEILNFLDQDELIKVQNYIDLINPKRQTAAKCIKEIIAFFTGEPPDYSLSTKTLSRWNKEVFRISLYQNRLGESFSSSFSYGIMVDESTRGDKKAEEKLGESVAKAILQ